MRFRYLQAALGGLLFVVLPHAVAAMEPGWHDDQSIDVDGATRYFRYYIPEPLQAGPAAAVFVLHGGTSSMRNIMPPSGNPLAEWPTLADRHGFVLIVPNGVNRVTGDAFGDNQVWDDCRDDPTGEIRGDDVAFLDALTDWTLSALNLDPARLYFTGMSNGGMMSLRWASERPERVTAVAAFIANEPAGTECTEPLRGVPILLAHGTEDPLIPYAGGPVSGAIGGTVRSASETVRTWRDASGLSGDPDITTLADLDPDDDSTIEMRLWSDPGSGIEIQWLRMLGAGHSIPSIVRPLSPATEAFVGNQNHDLEGAAAAWTFMSRFASFPAISDGQWVNADPAFRGHAQGLTFDFLPSAGLLFVAWFTYDDLAAPPGEPDGNVGAPDQRWLTAQLSVDGDRAEGPIFSSSGGQFDAPPTGFQRTDPVGHMSIEFSACDAAQVDYVLDDPPLARQFTIQPLEQSAVGAFRCATFEARATDPAPSTADWEPVRQALQDSGFANVVALVGDGRGRRFEHRTGAATQDTPMRSASAIKWVTSAIILSLVEQGVLSLDDHPQHYLDWWTDVSDDPRRQVTIEHLLSFTSGFRGTPFGFASPPCIGNPGSTIDACARAIHDDWFFDLPGTTYYYGPSHMQILGAIAQAATGLDWATIARQQLIDPLGMADTEYVNPSVDNPRLAGGATLSARDLEAFLIAMLDRSRLPTTFEAMITDHTPENRVTIGFTPIDENTYAWHYGLGVWRECPAAEWLAQCDSPKILSTTGAFGMHGWINVDRGYYGVLASDVGFGGADAVIDLAQDLRPLIEQTLAVD